MSYVLGKNTKLTVHLSTQEHNMDTYIQCEKPDEFRGGGLAMNTRLYVCSRILY